MQNAPDMQHATFMGHACNIHATCMQHSCDMRHCEALAIQAAGIVRHASNTMERKNNLAKLGPFADP